MKKNLLFSLKQWFVPGAAALVAALGLPAQAGLQVPYAADSATLHLWHMNEPAGSTALADSVGGITLNVLGLPTTPPYTNTTTGAPGYPGLSTGVSATTKQRLLFGGSFTNASQFYNTSSGAFTFEALIKPGINPLGTIDAEIICGDNGLGLGNRGWQWRIFNGVMEWNLLAGGAADNDFKATLPATGVDAAASNNWYHVAVTFSGDTPTNGDTPNILTFYWTLMDSNRVNADMLGQYTMSRPLTGLPTGTNMPNLGIAGSGRISSGANVGNGEGLIGTIDEVRISSVARSSNQMAFITGGGTSAPTFTQQPAASTLSGYNQTLTLVALASGTPPLTYQWFKDGSLVAGQTATTLVISNATFAQNGNYELVVTNAYGSNFSATAAVTIGAVPTGLANTGLDASGVVSPGDVVDPNWILANSADPANFGPRLFIFENSNPLQSLSSPNGNFSPTNGISMWSGVQGNLGGTPPPSPAGSYAFRSKFLIDQADPATVSLGGQVWVSSAVNDIVINGKSTGTTIAPGVGLYSAAFSLTNGFVAGWNTVDFVENPTAAGTVAMRVEIHGVGQALPAGLPTIVSQPQSQSVRDGNNGSSEAVLSVVALGRPPLTYQWLSSGSPIAGETNRTLTFINPTAGGQGSNFSVVVRNDSGPVTSQTAVLTVVATNQPPVPAAISFVTFQGQTLTLQYSRLILSATDYDGDPITIAGLDSNSAKSPGTNNIAISSASLVFTPVPDYVGPDSFNYQLTDGIDTSSGTVSVLSLSTPISQVVAPGGSASFNVGLSTAPANFTFQWQFNGANIAGATNVTLSLSNVQLADSGSYVLVTTDSSGIAWPSPAGVLTVGIAGSGTGLTGDYYANVTNTGTNFEGVPTLTRLDPTVNFTWSTVSPDPGIPLTYYEVRWHGQVQPLYTETYTFSTTSDDGSRLWVNGQLLANQWQAQAAATASGQIALTAGQKYDLVMEYFQATSFAVAQLSWSSAHQGQEIIPQSQLFPSAILAPTLNAKITGTSLTINWAGTFTLQSAPAVTGPWTSVSDLVGPYTVPANAGQGYYRLVNLVTP